MTQSRQDDDRMNRETFAAELQRLVARAEEDGVELGGGYNVRSPHPEVPDFTVEITEQEKLVSDGGLDTVDADPPPSGGSETLRELQRRTIGRFLLAPP
jgi:hypothetical protein